MKLKILTITISASLLLGGCTKQTEPEAAEVDYKAQFEESDRKIRGGPTCLNN